MPDKPVPGNRQEVSKLVDGGESLSLNDVEYQQDKKERGVRVRSRREELGHTIEDFSEITGLSIRTITDVELGRTSPRADTLVILCEHLKITADYILGLRIRNYDDVMQDAKSAHLVRAFLQFANDDKEMVLFFIEFMREWIQHRDP